jgi:hypothetical protein
MTASAKCNIVVELDGLNKNIQLPVSFATTTTPTTFAHLRQTQSTTGVAEALDIGDVTTPLLIVMECITNDVNVDTSFNTSFNSELLIKEGEASVFVPTGTVYIKNNVTEEVSTVEYLVIGT